MDRDFWVFGYASLIWNPGFQPVERVLARAEAHSRSFCMWSIHHRGRPEAPGLVLALDGDEGAFCDGLALRVPGAQAGGVLAYLRERELVSSAYREEVVPLRLRDGRRVEALAYVVRRDHVQYCGGLSLEEQARIIARARGDRGPNAEYLFETAAHLSDLGIGDPVLADLAARVRAQMEADDPL
ncbi:MAG: gamma-glutamylcyclotransferase [Rhodobacteraceae bacterium]|nr:gamma-glutamylcyclotransferase [Paracoccaceae bacterium]